MGGSLTINSARVGGADAILCRRILIDTGEPNRPDYIELLHRTLSDLKARVQRILITHWHWDHIGGVEGVCGLYSGKHVLWGWGEEGWGGREGGWRVEGAYGVIMTHWVVTGILCTCIVINAYPMVSMLNTCWTVHTKSFGNIWIHIVIKTLQDEFIFLVSCVQSNEGSTLFIIP